MLPKKREGGREEERGQGVENLFKDRGKILSKWYRRILKEGKGLGKGEEGSPRRLFFLLLYRLAPHFDCGGGKGDEGEEVLKGIDWFCEECFWEGEGEKGRSDEGGEGRGGERKGAVAFLFSLIIIFVNVCERFHLSVDFFF